MNGRREKNSKFTEKSTTGKESIYFKQKIWVLEPTTECTECRCLGSLGCDKQKTSSIVKANKSGKLERREDKENVWFSYALASSLLLSQKGHSEERQLDYTGWLMKNYPNSLHGTTSWIFFLLTIKLLQDTK